MSWWSTLDSNDKSFWTNYIIRRLSLAVYCLYATNSGMPRCCIIFAPVFHTFISGKDHYKTRSLSLSHLINYRTAIRWQRIEKVVLVPAGDVKLKMDAMRWSQIQHIINIKLLAVSVDDVIVMIRKELPIGMCKHNYLVESWIMWEAHNQPLIFQFFLLKFRLT